MNFTLINNIIMVCAKRRSGKSILIRYLVNQYKEQYEKIFVICPTEDINKFYQSENFVDKKNIFNDYDDEWVNKLICSMTKINEGLIEGKDNNKAKKVLLILDDCCSDVNMHSLVSLKKLFTRGRHCFISVIITSQFINQISPIGRTNTDFCIIGQMNEHSINIVSDEYRRIYDNKNFIKMYKENTKDFQFLIINNNSVKSNDINEIYKTIKVPKEYI